MGAADADAGIATRARRAQTRMRTREAILAVIGRAQPELENRTHLGEWPTRPTGGTTRARVTDDAEAARREVAHRGELRADVVECQRAADERGGVERAARDRVEQRRVVAHGHPVDAVQRQLARDHARHRHRRALVAGQQQPDLEVAPVAAEAEHRRGERLRGAERVDGDVGAAAGQRLDRRRRVLARRVDHLGGAQLPRPLELGRDRRRRPPRARRRRRRSSPPRARRRRIRAPPPTRPRRRGRARAAPPTRS